MNHDELFERYLTGALSATEREAFARLLRDDTDAANAFVLYAVETAALIRIGSQLQSAAAEAQRPAAVARAPGAGRRLLWPLAVAAPPRRTARWLALAAGLALALGGGWWFYPRLAGAPALGLRLAALAGEVAVTRAGQAFPAKPGIALQGGDQVAVTAGGTAALQYDGEATRIELQAATATFRNASGAKRVRLDAGLLRCTAAPQRQPFRLETPHAVAEVVGTRFWLDVAQAETVLAVHEGKVALRQKDKSLEVKVGETAVADAAGLRKLPSADAWIRDLLARAEAAPWDAVDLQRGQAYGAQGRWRADLRGTPAERRIWQSSASTESSAVLFDTPRWKRGVIVGRLLLLPDGQLPAALAVPAAATKPAQNASDTYVPLTVDGPCVVVFALKGGTGVLPVTCYTPCTSRDTWFRFALYFDTNATGGTVILTGAWFEPQAVPPATAWRLEVEKKTLEAIADHPLGLGLATQGAGPVLWQGLKLVPLGAELPLPPPEGWGRGDQ